MHSLTHYRKYMRRRRSQSGGREDDREGPSQRRRGNTFRRAQAPKLGTCRTPTSSTCLLSSRLIQCRGFNYIPYPSNHRSQPVDLHRKTHNLQPNPRRIFGNHPRQEVWRAFTHIARRSRSCLGPSPSHALTSGKRRATAPSLTFALRQQAASSAKEGTEH